MRLSFGRDGALRISLPYWVPYQAGIEFARSRGDWIRTHKPNSPTHLQHQDKIGKAHRLLFKEDVRKLKPTVRTAQNQIVVSYPSTMTLEQSVVQSAAERGALKALKSEAEQLLPQRLRFLAEKNNFTYRAVGVKKLASRWGSCSQAKDITLNVFLMQLPWHLIDYVLVHELVHTEHLNHSSEFWQRFERAMPGAKKLRKELKTYQTVITSTLSANAE
jgi:predicted metal-dependent hydrolase